MPEKLTAMGGEPGKGLVVVAKKGSTPQSDDADLRDSINVLVGGGYKGLSDEAARGNFTRIASLIGLKKATDLFVHISQQNQRPGWMQMKPQDRVASFYDIGSRNPATNEILQKMKAYGTGPLAGYSDSINYNAQDQQGNGVPGIIQKIADYTKR